MRRSQKARVETLRRAWNLDLDEMRRQAKKGIEQMSDEEREEMLNRIRREVERGN